MGANQYWQLGDGTRTTRFTPVKVENLSEIKNVATMIDTSFALNKNGTVWSWGRNDKGALGDGTYNERRTVLQIPGLSDVVEIHASLSSIFAVKSDGSIWYLGFYGPSTMNKPTLLSSMRMNVAPTDSVTSALEQAESSLTQEDLDIALELINQLPDSTEKTEFVNYSPLKWGAS